MYGLLPPSDNSTAVNNNNNTFNTETNDVSTMNSNNRIAATLFRREIVCLRNISTNTLHKGDDDDDYDDNNNNKSRFFNCEKSKVEVQITKP